MLGYGTDLNILGDVEYRWTTTQEWTPHSGRVSTPRTHVHPSAGNPVGQITVHDPFVYTHQAPCGLLQTCRTVLKDLVSPTRHHTHTKDITALSNVTLVVLKDYLTHVGFRSYIHGVTSRYTFSRTMAYTNAPWKVVLQMTPKTASKATSLAMLTFSPSDLAPFTGITLTVEQDQRVDRLYIHLGL